MKSDALTNLGWPFSMMASEGILAWNIRDFEPSARFGHAMVAYRKGSLQALSSARDRSGQSILDVEIDWAVARGVAFESRAKLNGAPCLFADAIEAFRASISTAAPPLFKPSSGKTGALQAPHGEEP